MTEEDVRLVELPDLGETLKRDWPRLATRAAAALALPVLVALLAKALDLYGPVAALNLPLEFLARGPFAYEAKVVWAVALALVLLAFLSRERAPAFVLAVATGALLWTGFAYSRLQWTRLFAPDFLPLRLDAPSPLAWLWGALLLATAVAFLVAEGLLDTREAQARRGLPEEERRALLREGARTAGAAAGGGMALALALGVVFWSLKPLMTGLPFRANPVFVLFAMGVLLAVAVSVLARPRDG